MLSTLVKITVSKKESPEDIRVFYTTQKISWKLPNVLNYYFNITKESERVYGLPNGIKLTKINDLEDYFNINLLV